MKRTSWPGSLNSDDTIFVPSSLRKSYRRIVQDSDLPSVIISTRLGDHGFESAGIQIRQSRQKTTVSLVYLWGDSVDLLETCVLNGIYQGLMVGYKRIECLNELELPERDFPRPRSVRGGEKMSKALSRVMTWEGRIDKHSAYQEDVDVFGWALGDVLPPIPKDARVRVGRSESTEDKLSENRKTLSTQRYDHFGRTWNTETWSEVQRLQETISRSPRVELRVWEKEDSLSFLPDS